MTEHIINNLTLSSGFFKNQKPAFSPETCMSIFLSRTQATNSLIFLLDSG